jgi:hypothetical protein
VYRDLFVSLLPHDHNFITGRSIREVGYVNDGMLKRPAPEYWASSAPDQNLAQRRYVVQSIPEANRGDRRAHPLLGSDGSAIANSKQRPWKMLLDMDDP